MHLTAKFQVPKVNFDRFRQALHEKLSESLAEAAKQWLMAVVPVHDGGDSGMERGVAGHVLAPGKLCDVCLGACSGRRCS